MDLQWKIARQRHWIELGAREGLTNEALARRAGVGERTVRRWCTKFRDEELARYVPIASIPSPSPDPTAPAVDLSPFEPAKPLVAVNPSPDVEAQARAKESHEPEPTEPVDEASTRAFAEVVPAAPPAGPQIQIDVQGGGRVVLSGPLDPGVLSRLIAVLKPC
jgi:hypothetical protein